MSAVLYPLLWLLAAAPDSGPAPAPAAPAVAAVQPAETDRALAELARIEKTLAALGAQKKTQEAAHAGKLATVESYRKARASWNRDRKLRDARAEAQQSAAALAALEGKLLAAAQGRVPAQQKALAAVERELSVGGLESARQARLLAHKQQLDTALAALTRPIRMPDMQIDELSDPEELAEQAELIRRTEAKLVAQYDGLRLREDKYKRIVRLRSAHGRDAELGSFTGDDVRRNTGRVRTDEDAVREDSPNGSLSGEPNVPQNETGPQSEGGPSGGFPTTAVILSDVIDERAEKALRDAGRSTDPDVRAKAAGTAAEQVRAQLERLRAQRKLIEERERSLRK